MKPFLSIVVPCRNEGRFIARCLDSILQGDYPADRMEVLMIDGQSADGTRELIQQYAAKDPRVRLIDNPEQITPCALNHGLDEARGEIIARIDGHAEAPPYYFRRLVEMLLESGADNVGGLMCAVPQDAGLFAEPIVAALSTRFGVGGAHYRFPGNAPREVDTVWGGCWRREVFDRIGRFNTALRRSQDIEFNRRLAAAGGRLLFVPDIKFDYFARSRMGIFWRHNFINGEWSVLPLLYSHVMPVCARHLTPLAFVAALVLGVALTPWTPWLLLAVAVPYVLANIAASVQVAIQKKRPQYLLLMPIVFLSLHLAYGLGSLKGLCKLAASWRSTRAARIEENACLPQS